MSENGKEKETVREQVRAGYGEIAKSGGSSCGATPTCCGSTPAGSEQLAKHIGYNAEELAALPDGANTGLSCGNPTALASLRPGEVVLGLGSGRGFHPRGNWSLPVAWGFALAAAPH